MKIISPIVCFIFFQLVCGQIVQAQDWPELNRYHEANEKLKQDSANKVTAVYIGDSITDYWIGASPDFFADNHYADRGINGQTSPQVLLRFRADVISLKPNVVIILCGTNDIAGNTGPSTLEMIQDNIASMAELAKVNKIKVILCSVLPANKFWWSEKIQPADSIITLNQWIKLYARHQKIHYVDYYSSMVDEKKGLKKEYSDDGVHPNKAGYTIMEKLAQKAVRKLL
jgi:lysophospholipase L1-like esterase